MKAARRSYLFPLVFLIACVAAGAQAGSLSGVIRNEQGAPVKDAQIKLTRSENSSGAFVTTSDAKGGYQFLSLPTGTYHLEVSLSGFETRQSEAISISGASANATMDLTLRISPGTASRPQFEASGVRGLIDPGGYSASSNAAAASGLLKGIADIKRTGNDSPTGQTMGGSCALEPALEKAVKDKPESGEANLKLGEFYLAHDQPAKAVPILEHARSIDKGDREKLEQLARAYLKTGQFDAAQKALTQAVGVQGDPEIERLLARADEGTGKFVEASREYQLAAKQDPSEENLFGTGYELILAGLVKDAALAFEAGLKRYPRSIQLLIGLGSAQFFEGHASESVQTLLNAVQLNAADPRPYPFLAQASGISSEDVERVHGAFEHFLSIAPGDLHAGYYLALNLLHHPGADHETNERRVEALLQQAIVLDPGLADAHFQLGVLYGRRGDYQRAAAELETAIRLSPNLKEAHYRLAIAYRQTGRMDLSAKEMQRFREAQEPQKPGMGVSIDQFISVFAAPESAANRESLCPGDTP